LRFLLAETVHRFSVVSRARGGKGEITKKRRGVKYRESAPKKSQVAEESNETGLNLKLKRRPNHCPTLKTARFEGKPAISGISHQEESD